MGGAILENLGEMQNTNVQKGYRGAMMCCVRSWPRRQIPLGAARYPLSIKVNLFVIATFYIYI